jgi:hypothetical protein
VKNRVWGKKVEAKYFCGKKFGKKNILEIFFSLFSRRELAKSFYFVCFQFFGGLSVSPQFYPLFQKKLNFVYLKSHILVGNRDLLLFWEKKFFQKKSTKTGE